MGSYPAIRGTESRYYKVTIYSKRLGRSIVGSLPEQWEETITAKWQPFLKGGGISAVEQIARLAGYSFKIKELSRMVWDGNEPLKITMPLTFTSYANPKLEVEQPIDDLKKIASPRENTAPNDYLKNVVSGAGKTGGKIIKGLKNLGAKAVKAVANEITILEPPGPGLLKQSTVGSGSDKIDIYLGTNVKGGKSYFRLYENVVIQSVQAKYWRDFSPQGYAHRGAANIQFQTMDVWTWDDVDKVRSSIG